VTRYVEFLQKTNQQQQVKNCKKLQSLYATDALLQKSISMQPKCHSQ